MVGEVAHWVTIEQRHGLKIEWNMQNWMRRTKTGTMEWNFVNLDRHFNAAVKQLTVTFTLIERQPAAGFTHMQHVYSYAFFDTSRWLDFTNRVSYFPFCCTGDVHDSPHITKKANFKEAGEAILARDADHFHRDVSHELATVSAVWGFVLSDSHVYIAGIGP